MIWQNYFLLSNTSAIPDPATITGISQDAVICVPAKIREVCSIGISVPPIGAPGISTCIVCPGEIVICSPPISTITSSRCEDCIKSYNDWHNQTPEERLKEQQEREKLFGGNIL